MKKVKVINMKFRVGDIVMRSDEDFVPGVTQIFRVEKVRKHNRVDIVGVDYIGNILSKDLSYKDISVEFLKKVGFWIV